MKPIAYKMIDDGFLSVVGTIENNFLSRKTPDSVGKGKPMTWNTNNGLIVIYDDTGLPWIKSRKLMTPEYEHRLSQEYQLQQEGYVPHSNDGGMFIRKMAEMGVYI